MYDLEPILGVSGIDWEENSEFEGA
jgi:hypothetical protein